MVTDLLTSNGFARHVSHLLIQETCLGYGSKEYLQRIREVSFPCSVIIRREAMGKLTWLVIADECKSPGLVVVGDGPALYVEHDSVLNSNCTEEHLIVFSHEAILQAYCIEDLPGPMIAGVVKAFGPNLFPKLLFLMLKHLEGQVKDLKRLAKGKPSRLQRPFDELDYSVGQWITRFRAHRKLLYTYERPFETESYGDYKIRFFEIKRKVAAVLERHASHDTLDIQCNFCSLQGEWFWETHKFARSLRIT